MPRARSATRSTADIPSGLRSTPGPARPFPGLYDVAKRLDVKGRSTMTKDELVAAIRRANNRESAKARKK